MSGTPPSWAKLANEVNRHSSASVRLEIMGGASYYEPCSAKRNAVPGDRIFLRADGVPSRAFGGRSLVYPGGFSRHGWRSPLIHFASVLQIAIT